MQNSLLLVDDEPNISKSLTRLLRKEHYDIYIAESGEEALELLQKHKIKVILSDERMPRMTGSQLFSKVKEQYPDTLRIIISGYADFQSISNAINKGAIYKFLAKPWDNDVLKAEIREAFNTQELIQRNRQLDHLFNSTIEAIAICNAQGIIESVNPAFCNLSQYSEKDAIGNPLTSFFLNSYEEPIPEYFNSVEPDDEWHGELICVKKTQKNLPVWLSFTALKGHYKEPYYAAMFIDITEQKKKEAHIEFQAYHDSLTGLGNRRLFNDHLSLAFHQRKRSSRCLAILFMDLDRFKIINDTLGHSVGDELLIEVSKRLISIARKGETLARLGGDEFVIILPSLNKLDESEMVAKKVLALFKEPFKIGRHTVHVSCSIGINSTDTDIDNQDLLVSHADNAMYRAKSRGGNCFQYYDSVKNNQVKDLLKTEHALHEAIKNDEFILYYQPQVNPQSGQILSCEALVRWQHPEKGLQSPATFINIAERNGLILPISQRILHQACEKLSSWWQQDNTQCHLSVNLSARQFNEPDLLENICELISRYQLNPNWLEVEVTESILINDLADSIKTPKGLRDIGVGVGLDDFGTGYSSLSYLKQLPITTLKIDQSFVRELPSDGKSSAITRLLLGLAKGLDMKVVAEGVETHEQYEFLKNEGCDLIQGYIISPAVTARKMEALMKSNPEYRLNVS